MPSIALRERSGEAEFNLRPACGPRVLLAVHDIDCDECIGYVKEVASICGALRSWGADLMVISPGTTKGNDALLAPIGVRMLEDAEHVVTDGRLTILIADEWGELYFVSESDGAHGIVAPEEVLEWVKFIAIQCPECEGPEGEWRNL